MTTKELKDIFGQKFLKTICDDKISEYHNELKELKVKERLALEAFANSQSDHAWLYENRLELLGKAITEAEKQKSKWEWRKKQLYAKDDMPLQGLNLDAIKAIPCESLLPPPVHSNHATSHYKAPWRNEKSPSLVVYHKQNRWWDFGETTGGTVIDLVMKLEDCDFKEACQKLRF